MEMNGRSFARAWWVASMVTRAAVCLLVTLLTFWVLAPRAFAQTPAASASAAPAHGRHASSDLDDELPPDVREKLTPEQLHDIMLERSKRPPPAPHSKSSVEIVVPVALFAMIIGIVGIALYAGYRRERQRHETLRLAIEKGADIPMALLATAPAPRSDLRRGLLLLSAGVGLGILIFATNSGHGAWTAALIPTFLGVAYLVMYRFEQSKSPPEPKLPGA
jgi:hypothetical protein